jgi:glucoamylase
MESLDRWVDRQYRRAAEYMLLSVSPVGLTKSRPGFGQTIRPARGAIVASPVLASYDPDPDYFFHWFRDSAVVLDALRVLYDDGTVGDEAVGHLGDFVRFSLALAALDGRALAAASDWRSRVAADFEKFVRSDEELRQIHGQAVAADTRVNADGTLDISRWVRPQHDGPALRALALLRWAKHAANDPELEHALGQLIGADLSFILSHGSASCYDIWEEERGLHFYTLLVSRAALDGGALWLESKNMRPEARACRTGAERIAAMLPEYWTDAGYYRSRVLDGGSDSNKALDIAVILAALHAGPEGGEAADDDRMHATLTCIESLFEAEYPINHNRPAYLGPALGRYSGDAYYSGGAYYFATLAGAEFCFRAASARGREPYLHRGDAYLETVRAYTPESGELSEQFDRTTGAQTSARHLAWSYAAFITCIAARRAVEG